MSRRHQPDEQTKSSDEQMTSTDEQTTSSDEQTTSTDEQTTSSAHIPSKTKEWMGNCLKKSCQY
jgi:hypothetical protein